MVPVVDPHVHLQLDGWPQLGAVPHPLAAYQSAVADLDVGRFGLLVMARRGGLAATREMNDAALAVAKENTRAFAMCSVHPSDGPAALTELSRVAGLGAKGVKLHPNTQAFDVADDGVREVVTRAGELGLPVLFDSVSASDPGQPEKFMALSMACPNTDLVLAHAFGPKFQQAVLFAMLAKYPWVRRNVYLELSATAVLFAGSPYAEHLAWICRNHGMDRVLWGSDYPLYTPREALEAIRSYGFSDDELAQLTRSNAERLLRL